jgi:SRSO17 transposase
MGLASSSASESRFAAYVEGLVSAIGHADRTKPLRDYCVGLMMPCERKSVEPMAAVTAPAVIAQAIAINGFPAMVRWIASRAPMDRRRPVSMTERMFA